MRTYSVVNGRFWTQLSETGTEIRALGLDAVAVALYLITNPHSNALGVYYLPLATMSHDLCISQEVAQRILEAVCSTGFAEYFAEESVVWVPQQARYQIGETMKATDHRRAWALRELKKFEGTVAYEKFLERYAEAFHLLPPPAAKPKAPLRLVPEGERIHSRPPSPLPGQDAPEDRMAQARKLSELLDESSRES